MNLRIEELVKLLEQTVAQQGLQEIAVEHCKTALINSSQEDEQIGQEPLNGHKVETILLDFSKHSLVFKNERLSYPYIETVIGLYIEDKVGIYLDELKPIGEYRLITRLDGEIEDDYLIVYKNREEK